MSDVCSVVNPATEAMIATILMVSIEAVSYTHLTLPTIYSV